MKIKFVCRHIWEKDRSLSNYEVWSMRNTPQLGIWFKRGKAVGRLKKGTNQNETIKQTFDKSNLVPFYMIGFNLIVCKIWFNITLGKTL